MLILSRYEGESIYIGDDIQITVFETKNGQVFLGIDAPKEIPVHRAEIYYRNKHQQRMGSSHQGSSHQGSSHQGSSHQGSSHQGSSHQGSSSGNAGYDRPSHHMRGGQGDSSPRQHISHDEAHEADGNIRQESPEKEHHGGVRSFRRRSNSTRVQYRQSRRYPKTAAKPEDDAIEANGNVLAVDGNVR